MDITAVGFKVAPVERSACQVVSAANIQTQHYFLEGLKVVVRSRYEREARVHDCNLGCVQNVLVQKIELCKFDLPSVLVECVNPVQLGAVKQIRVRAAEPDLRWRISLVLHLRVHTKDLLINQTMLFHLRQYVIVQRVLKALAQAKTHVAISVRCEKG